MALVDYTSDDSEDASTPDKGVQAKASLTKRQKTAHGTSKNETESKLPPLPSAFHDLYASTVRVSTTDDPALHQGRKRRIPHVVGNWPSHLYVEWHPSHTDHALLVSLLDDLQSTTADSVKISTFLTSDLGAPSPLHVSLSSPIALNTSEKDTFLEKLVDSTRNSGIDPFELIVDDLCWHRTPESERSFLVLKVTSGNGTTNVDQAASSAKDRNPELTALLQRSNTLALEVNQAPLYSQANVGQAFHVSIAWSFAKPDADLVRQTEEVFSKPQFSSGLKRIRIVVDGIKAKIGNVVTHVPLGRST